MRRRNASPSAIFAKPVGGWLASLAARFSLKGHPVNMLLNATFIPFEIIMECNAAATILLEWFVGKMH